MRWLPAASGYKCILQLVKTSQQQLVEKRLLKLVKTHLMQLLKTCLLRLVAIATCVLRSRCTIMQSMILYTVRQ
jgi:hypothetical protein